MPIYQTASNKWQVNFRKKGVAFKKTVASKTEADALERECQRCFDYNLPLPDSKNSSFGMTSSILFQRTAQKYWADTDWGIVQIRRQEKILDVLGRDVPVNDIDYDKIDDVIQHFKRNGASASSLNKINAVISKALNLGVDKGWIDRKPKLEWIKTDNARHRFVIEEEEELMWQVLDDRECYKEKEFFMCLIDTGMRRGEAMNLRARDVNLEHNRIDINKSKNDLARSIPMTNRVKLILAKKITSESRIKNSKLFDLTEDRIRRAWETMRTDMELDDDKEFVLHCLRHTCASRLVQRGVQIQVVQQWLGHKSIQMTLRYAHLNVNNLMDAVHVLNQDKNWNMETVSV
jgi:integrase